MATQTGSIDLTTSNSVKLAAEAGWQNDLEDYYTKSEINVTVQGINSEVSKKVNGTEVISSINQSAESVSINANKVNLQGAVTISDLSSDAQSATLNSNISVGGRNLLGNTENRSGSAVVENTASTSTFGSIGRYNDAVSLYSLVSYDGYSNAVSCATSTSTGNRGAGWYTRAGEIRAGETYTFSCRVKCSIATNIHTHTAWRNGSATAGYAGWTAGGTKAISANTWTDYSYTFVPASNARLEWEFFVALCITGSSSGATYQMAHAKLEKGNTATDWSPALEDVVVGGRNLLHGTSTMTAGDGRWDTSRTFRASGGTLSNVTTSGLPIRGVSGALRVTNTGSSAAQIGFAQDRVEGLLTGETYTQGAWVRASTTVDVYHQSIYKDGNRVVKGAPVSIGTDWTYISYTGTLTGTQATDFYSAGYMYAQAVPANGWFEVCGIKLEKGNKATDWSPAPEDVDSAISDAAKTATSYVTEVTGQNGIMVHPSGNQNTGVRVTSDVDIMRDGNSVLNVGTQGDTTSTDAGVTIYDGTASKNVVARFDSDEVSLGANSEASIIDMCGGVFTFEVDNSDPTKPMASIRVNANADGVTAIPTLRLTAGTGTDQYGFDIAGIGSAQYPISVVAGNRNVVNMGGLGLQTSAIDLAGIGGGGTISAYDGVYEVTSTGTNFWSTVPGTVLWSGSYFMTASHTANLSYNVSTCPTGIVLHFQPYTSSTTQNYYHQYCFVPKTAAANYSGMVHNFTLCNSGFAKVGMKALRIYDNRIVGDDSNDDTGTASGITFDNKYWVMTQVIAV